MHSMNHALFSAAILVILTFTPATSQSTACLQAGFYISSAGNACAECPAGSYCPAGVSQSFRCPPGTYQGMRQAVACLPCLEDYLCTFNGTVDPVKCPAGRTNPPGSPAARCGDCNYEQFFFNVSASSCVPRTVYCNLETHYEVPTPLNRTREATCMPLKICKTNRMPLSAPVENAP